MKAADETGPASALRLTYLGHAAVAMHMAGCLLVTDPVLRGHVTFLRWVAPRQRIPASTNGGITLALISHLHHDHCDLPSLRRLVRLSSGRLTLVVPSGSEGFLRRHGLTRVVPMAPGDTADLGPIVVTATEAAHSGRRGLGGVSAEALGYLVAGAGRAVYFAGDTDLFPGMSSLPSPDVALIPVAGWGRTLGPGHLNWERAVEATAIIRPEVAVPIHWGGLQPFWYRPLWPRKGVSDARYEAARAYEAGVAKEQLPTQVRVLAPGASTSC